LIYIIAPCNLDIKRDMIFLFMYALVSAGVSTSSESITPRAPPRLFAFASIGGRKDETWAVCASFSWCPGADAPGDLVAAAHALFSERAIAKGKCRFVASKRFKARARSCVRCDFYTQGAFGGERETQLTHLCAGCSLFSLCATAFGWNFSAEAKHA
jgi:hypothetical protein